MRLNLSNPPVTTSRRIASILLSALFFVPATAVSQVRSQCSEPTPMAEIVARSDLIAVVKIVQRNTSFSISQILSGGSATVRVDGIAVEIVEVIKRPFVEGFDFKNLQRIHHPARAMRRDEESRAIAFLRYSGKNTWLSHGCGLLPLDVRDDVYLACDAITDLFGHDRFLRERKCLLAHPGIVDRHSLVTEIRRHTLHARQYEGHADVVALFPWAEGQPFQRVILRVRGRNLQKLLPEKFRGSEITLTGYLPSEHFDPQSYEREFRKGRRIEVQGTWFEGNFVLDPQKRSSPEKLW